MRTFDFGPDRARQQDRFGSSFAMARIVHSDQLHVGCMYVPPGGGVGRHPAATYQLFVVLHGHGWTRTGAGEREPIDSGQAMYWEPSEEHEAGSDHGMTVIIIEGDAVQAGPEQTGPVQKLSEKG